MNGPTPEIWALVEWWQAILDFVVWWILAPCVGFLVVLGIISSILEDKK